MEKKKNYTVIIVILALLVVGLGGYIVYDKMVTKESVNTENTKTNKENTEYKNDNNKNENEKTEDDNYIKTRKCSGVYSGEVVIYKNVQTGGYDKGTLTIELKEDGTYSLKKESSDTAQEEYTIVENTLLLKTSPDVCGPDSKCSPNYTQYLNINEECSIISNGYGSYFFNPDFILNKTN